MNQQIHSLTVSNYKGVRGEVTLHPNGESLQILAGPNGSGKSSFIDAIAELFDPKGTRLTSKPINADAEEAFAELVTDRARIRRTWKKDDAGTLTAWKIDEDGDEVKPKLSPRDFVLKATGGALFDPEAFINLDEKKQREQLLERVELPFDLAELDEKRASVYSSRTDSGREVDSLAGQLMGMPPADPTLPAEETPSSAILAELDKVRAHNAEVAQSAERARQATAERERVYAETTRLSEAFEASKLAAAAAQIAEQEAGDALSAASVKDESPLVDRLANADEMNAKIRAQRQRAAVEAKLAESRAAHDELEAKIKAIDKQKADGLAAAVFPLSALSVDDDGITFEGTPFKQLNDAMKTLVAFDLATSGQPDIRLFYVKRGDLLDADSMAAITAKATERGYFLMMERDRDESRSVGATFSGGKLVSA